MHLENLGRTIKIGTQTNTKKKNQTGIITKKKKCCVSKKNNHSIQHVSTCMAIII